MTATETMEQRSQEIRVQQDECITNYGNVIASKRYEYQSLIREAKEVREALDFMYKLAREVTV